MLFVAPEFLLIFLPIVLGIFWGLERSLGRNWALAGLLCASVVFYAVSGWSGLVLLMASLVANFFLGHWLAKTGWRGALALAVGANLALLGVFKYADFLIQTFGQITGHEYALLKLRLPLGISFFTFQQIVYLVQCHRLRRAEITWRDYGLAVTFFPHLIAGPLVHYRDLVGQFRSAELPAVARARFHEAISLLIIALGKKLLVADTLSPVASAVFNGAGHGQFPTPADAWLGALAYTFQIYFDFSAYSEMALALALLFGLRLPVNFLRPYSATSLREFWQRWHISLSEFLREYVYFALGGNRRGVGRRWANLLITMTLGGLWHGAGWTFLLWGALHGLGLGINHAWVSFSPARLPRPVGRMVTFAVVVMLWVPFRAESWAATRAIWCAMLGQPPAGALPSVAALPSMLDTAYRSLALHRTAAWDLPLWRALAQDSLPNWLLVTGAALLVFTFRSNLMLAESPRRRSAWRAFWLGLLLFALVARSFHAPAGEFLYFRF